MVIKSTKLDITTVLPNDTAFFFRIYSMRKDMAAYRLEQVTDFSYSYERGTDSTTTRTTRGVRNVTTRNGDDSKQLTFTTVESISVEAHELLRWAYQNGELIEIWEVTPTITADGATVLDNTGKAVPKGWMPDRYWVGTVNADDYSNNAGDATRTHEWTIDLENEHDQSWIQPIEWIFGDDQTYPNASLKKYTATDNPTSTVRDTQVDEPQPSSEASQKVGAQPATPS
ncbi:phage tail tube protein [Pseudolactococcus insecticola]|uniref:Phage tail protein n=1 Tax=Pseudolactococcus insecticola TaxID=2709158 RepID=A0A6A0B6B3_9LACT|nr:phage tail tube protein [Lactococcus insecticola]GFH39844.1 hypothetical protein Hs20B_02420 [Lactococcus insecticola]